MNLFLLLVILLTSQCFCTLASADLEDIPFINKLKEENSPQLNFNNFTFDNFDLENNAQDFILELKQFHIPENPHAFNPTITRYKGGILFAFRMYDAKLIAGAHTDGIGLVWLDENFNLISKVYPLEMRTQPLGSLAKKQDPRLIVINDHLYVIYSDSFKGIISSEVRRVCIAEIKQEEDCFFVDEIECLTSFEGEKELRWEKNWTPFEYNGELLLSYSLSPHRIFRYLGNGFSETVSLTQGSPQWNWGVLRGGSQAFPISETHYLSFFHSTISMKTIHSEGKNIPHYFMGAYLFSRTPPFEITHISPEPIIGKNFYTSPYYKTWKPLKVVFPDGFIFDDDYIWVVYGKQDHESWVAKLDRKKLLRSLVPVSYTH